MRVTKQSLVEELARVTQERDEARYERDSYRAKCDAAEVTIESLRLQIQDILDIARRALK